MFLGCLHKKNNFQYLFTEITWNVCNVAIAMTKSTIYSLNKGWLQVFCYRLNFFLGRYSQKHSPEVFCKKRRSWKFRKIHRKTPVSGSLEACDLKHATLLKKRLGHRCFPMNFTKFLKEPFLQNTSGRLLLYSVENLSARSYSVNKCR